MQAISRSLLCGCLIVLALFSVFGFPQDQQSNEIPRSNRGSFQLQNSKLSTARGFGKRGNNAMHNPQSIWNQFDENAFRSLKASSPNALIEEIQGNPEILRLIVDKIIDLNAGGELTPEELQRRNTF